MKKPGSLRYESLLSARSFVKTIDDERYHQTLLLMSRYNSQDYSSKYFLKTSINLFNEKYQIEDYILLPYISILQKRFLKKSESSKIPNGIKELTGDSIAGRESVIALM
jgi:hypothetical protein